MSIEQFLQYSTLQGPFLQTLSNQPLNNLLHLTSHINNTKTRTLLQTRYPKTIWLADLITTDPFTYHNLSSMVTFIGKFYHLPIIGIIVFAIYRYYKYKLTRYHIMKHAFNAYVNFLIKHTKQPPNIDLRSIFRDMQQLESKSVLINHPHAASAKIRNLASKQIELFCKLAGVEPYYFQMSKSDQRNNRIGSLEYTTSKQLNVVSTAFNPPHNCLVAMVDADMYVDMPCMLAEYPRPYLLATFQPTTVAHISKDYCYTFNKFNDVEYRVSGGSYYVHKVWNYGVDNIMVATRSSFYGFTSVNYVIDKRFLADNHQLILLSPTVIINSPFYDISSLLLTDKLLRYEVVFGEYLRLNIMTQDGLKRSTGRVGSYAQATISAVADDTIANISRISKVTLTVAQVKTTLKNEDPAVASVLVDYHRSGKDELAPYVYPISASVNRYQFEPDNFDPTCRASLKPYMSPLVPECFAPDHCISNDRAAVQGRVTDVKSNTIVTPQLFTIINEFVALLIPDDQMCLAHPVDIDFVFEKQNRPQQQTILKQASTSADSVDPFGHVQTFQKSEAYSDIKPPRIISTVPGVNKLTYSQFIYAFTEIIRKQRWYAFAKTPLEISEIVMEICSTAKSHVINSDLSKFDGRVSLVLRLLEQIAMLRYFHTSYHTEIIRIMATQQNQKAFTKFGVMYETGTIRLSGSSETADFNSLCNAFMAYLAQRMTMTRDGFKSPESAMDGLGIYGGDDGLTADLEPAVYVKACASVGQVLEVEPIKFGEHGVSFLSRQFSPFVWYGSLNSCCDISRQVSKLHVTPALSPGITALQKLGEKMAAYYLTDKNTPIIGTLSTFVVKKLPSILPQSIMSPQLRGVAMWFAKYPENVQFPNENESNWMMDYCLRSLPSFDHALFNKWLDDVGKQNASIINPPLCVPLQTIPTTAKIDVVLNDDLIKATPMKPTTLIPLPQKVCRDFIAGTCIRKVCKFAHVKA
jgi:hypothetical protein